MPPQPSSTALVNAIAGQTHLPVNQLFRKGEVVGKGAFGSVHRGVHIATGAVVALKIVNLDIADDDVEAIQKEVALLSQLRGGETTNVTQYYGCWLDGPQVWIVMDFASGGSVRTLMKAMPGGVLEERHTVVITREVLVALSFLHKAGVIHRDIKAANVLITAPGRVVVCDFGVSGLLATSHSKRATMVGTPYWMAPEVISGSLYDTKADIWSLGITIYEMMMKTPPHSDQVPMRAFILITSSPPPKLPENLGSRDMKDFLASCLKERGADRLSADELQKTKWIKAAKSHVNMLKELLATYNGWVQQGGIRDSIIPDGTDILQESFANTDGMNWEFDTMRGTGVSDGEPFDMTPAEASPAVSASYQAPRSLRMLFEDSTAPPSLSESFLRNNLGSSGRGHHGQVAASAPAAPSFLAPDALESQHSIDLEGIESDDIQTARQANFMFPRRAAASHDSDGGGSKTPRRRGEHSPNVSGSASRGRSPSPFKDPRASPGSQATVKAPPNFKEVRSNKGLPDIAIPPPSGTASTSIASSSPNEAPAAVGMPSISVGTVDTPPLARPSTAPSGDNSSPKASQHRARGRASPMNFQFPPPSNSRSTKSTGAPASSQARYQTPLSRSTASTKETPMDAQGLTPPKSLNLHHPASRSMDSPRMSVHQPGAPNLSSSALGALGHPGLNRSQTAGVYGSQSDSEAFGNGTDHNRLAPGRTFALKRQASVETGLSFGQKTGALRDALQLSALPLTADMLPPSPSNATSPAVRGLASHSDSPRVDTHSTNTSSTGTASVSTSISSATSVSMAYGPPIQPFNYSGLQTPSDVQGELAKVFEDLAIWLGVVETGLNGVLVPGTQSSAIQQGDDAEDVDAVAGNAIYDYDDTVDESALGVDPLAIR